MQVLYGLEDEKDDNKKGESIVVNVENELTSSTDIVNLKPGAEYHISVIAYTSVGPGVAANLSATTFTEKKKSM